MKKLFFAAVTGVLFLSASAFAAPPTQAPVQSPKQAPMQAPTQAPVQAPNKTAQANTGYRTYSYQPGMAPTNYGYYNDRNNGRPAFFSGHQPADYKVRGEFWAR